MTKHYGWCKNGVKSLHIVFYERFKQCTQVYIANASKALM
jgi:hypothetical protein